MKLNAYLINFNLNFPYRGKIAKVIGMKKIYTEYGSAMKKTELAYHLKFEDDSDYYLDVDLVEKDNWKFVTIDELLCVGMPQ